MTKPKNFKLRRIGFIVIVLSLFCIGWIINTIKAAPEIHAQNAKENIVYNLYKNASQIDKFMADYCYSLKDNNKSYYAYSNAANCLSGTIRGKNAKATIKKAIAKSTIVHVNITGFKKGNVIKLN